MAQLVFYDKGHVYEVDGVRLPSVSEILRFISREEYADVSQYTLDHAAERGTAVHRAIEQIIKTGECDVDMAYEGYIRAFVGFFEEHNCSFAKSELALACEDYAGTLDLVGKVDGLFSIVDVKNVCAVRKKLVKAQINAYKRLYERNYDEQVERLYCLQLLATGKYRLYPVAIDDTEFEACLALHKALEAKHKRGMIE